MGQFDLPQPLTCPSVSQDVVSRPPASHGLKVPVRNEASLNAMWNPRTDKEHQWKIW